MSPAELTLVEGATVRITATPRTRTGALVPGGTVIWSSENASVATVTPDGTVAAVGVGVAQIRATINRRTATASVTVTPAPVASVTLSPEMASLIVGESVQLMATLRSAAGAELTGRSVTWMSSDSSIASVSASGFVRSLGVGAVTIRATVEDQAGEVALRVRDRPLLSVRVEGEGSLILQNLATARVDTIASEGGVAFFPGDSMQISASAGHLHHFDGVWGPVTDSLHLIGTYGFRPMEGDELRARFVPRDVGTRRLQNAFFDTTVLNYRTSENFVAWWDDRFDNNYIAKDLLRQMEITRRMTDEWGIPPAPGSDQVYINIYLHRPRADVFDDGWGQGVGTDRFGMPFYTAPMPSHRVRITDSFCWCYGNVWHEALHIHAWGSGTFPYRGDHAWYVEASADWFEKYFTLNEGNVHLGYGTVHGTPAFLMQPQLRLWSPPGSPRWSRGVHAYAAHLFLLYLSWNGLMPDDFVGRSYASRTTLTPQEYMVQNIPNLKEAYRDFATGIVVLEGIPEWIRPNIAAAIHFWRTQGARYGNARPDGSNDDNTYALELNDAGTEGWVSPGEPLEGWAHAVTRLEVTVDSEYSVAFRSPGVSDQGSPADLFVGLVEQRAMGNRFSSLSLKDQQGTAQLNLEAGTVLYIVVVNTPEKMTGDDTYPFELDLRRIR
jgi:hypothetical protein